MRYSQLKGSPMGKKGFVLKGTFEATALSGLVDLAALSAKRGSRVLLLRLFEHMRTLEPRVAISDCVLDLDWCLSCIIEERRLNRVLDFGVWHEIWSYMHPREPVGEPLRIGAELLRFVAVVGQSIEFNATEHVSREMAIFAALEFLDARGHEPLIIRHWDEMASGAITRQWLVPTPRGKRLLDVSGRLPLPSDAPFFQLAREYLGLPPLD
jgi:hypothetical protein